MGRGDEMDEDDIERIAREICAAHGLDPEEMIYCGMEDTMTPHELSEVTTTHDMLWRLPLWRTYRGKAADAIAARLAILKLDGK